MKGPCQHCHQRAILNHFMCTQSSPKVQHTQAERAVICVVLRSKTFSVLQDKLSGDYRQVDAVLEPVDNSFEALYDVSLEPDKNKVIYVTYGETLDGQGMGLEVFDGGVGMAGMGPDGIAAWGTLVRPLLMHYV